MPAAAIYKSSNPRGDPVKKTSNQFWKFAHGKVISHNKHVVVR